MFNDPEFLRANKNSPVLRWVVNQLEEQKQDLIKVICMTASTNGDKLIQTQGKLALVEESLHNVKKYLTA